MLPCQLNWRKEKKMGKDSKIEWTDHTFNPWWGCVPRGMGCVHCYAKDFAERMGYDVWGTDNPRRVFKEKHWYEPIRWNQAAHKIGERHKVFCGSMCDIFETRGCREYNQALNTEREKLWNLIDATPHLIWLLLTKRPENIWKLLPDYWILSDVPSNVWFGVSTSTQAELDELWTILDSETHYLQPSVLFLSLEPLVEPVDLTMVLTEIDCGDEEHDWWTRAPDWVILGAESGRKRRPFDAAWAVGPYEQCHKLGIPFFGKQDSGLRPGMPLLINGQEVKEFPDVS